MGKFADIDLIFKNYFLISHFIPIPSGGTWKPGYAGGGSNYTLFESSYAVLLESAKNWKFAKLEFFAKTSYKVKMFAKKIPKNDKIYFLKSPWPFHFKYAKICAKFKWHDV